MREAYRASYQESEPLVSSNDEPAETLTVGFRVQRDFVVENVVAVAAPSDGLTLVREHRARFLDQGAMLFLLEHGFGREPDQLGLAPTSDPFEVVRRVQTDVCNYGHDNDAVIAWLRELQSQEPFTLLGAGRDFVEGRFDATVRDPLALALLRQIA